LHLTSEVTAAAGAARNLPSTVALKVAGEGRPKPPVEAAPHPGCRSDRCPQVHDAPARESDHREKDQDVSQRALRIDVRVPG
jgi:hypothetical protein